MDESILESKSYLNKLALSFSSKLGWGSNIVSIVKTVLRKIRPLICPLKFLSSEVALYLSKYTIWFCIKYCFHALAGTCSCYLDMLDKLQK